LFFSDVRLLQDQNPKILMERRTMYYEKVPYE